jgi:predicted dehydrogenase
VKILIVGLGSMGRRRVRNLQHLAAGDLLGCDIREDRRQEAASRYGIRTCASVDEGLAWNPDAVVISTPPDLHVHYARQAARAGKHFFTELNVVSDGLDELINEVRGRSIVAAPSATFRHHPSIRTLKELIDTRAAGRVTYFSYHSGQYLPDWHPYEDYRDYYVSKRQTGAGREMVPFELNWLTWLFGPVTEISCVRGKVSRLDADIDDLYQCLLTFGDGVRGVLVVDVVSRPAVRLARFNSDEGTLVWDAGERAVGLWSTRTNAWQEFPEPEPIAETGYITAENPYIDEMREFLAAVRGERKYGYTLEDDRQLLQTLYAAEQSSESGRRLSLNYVAVR